MKFLTSTFYYRLSRCRYLTTAVAIGTSLFTHLALADNNLLIQSTTSTANSGLYDHLLPAFESSANAKVHVVAVGTGQAIRNAANCDADVLLVHAKGAEQKFVADGNGVSRQDLMYNDFVIVGPAADPAAITKTKTAAHAVVAIATTQAVFASRGDNSGTHKKERALWTTSGIDTTPHNGKWYRETGSGMGATLNTAVGMNAYTLTDRATWISFNNKQTHTILFEGDDTLFNQYGIILVNPEKCPNVNVALAQEFIDWITGVEGQQRIAAYQLHGKQLFYPNASQE